MCQNNEFEMGCSINEMADKLHLSRPRFHQLRKLDVFPPPVYCPYTKRPHYPPNLANRCLRIREAGIGENGEPMWFYSPRKKKNVRRSQKDENDGTQYLKSLLVSLRELGIKATVTQVQDAMKVLFPTGLPEDLDDSSIIPDLFKYFRPERMNDV